MENNTKQLYARGVKDGIPVGLGYFAVSFALGITAKQAGLTALQATLTSLTVNASAGEYAGFTLILAGASYLELIVMMFVANARYLLMSCALSQKISPNTSFVHRLLVSFHITDEIFALDMNRPGKLNPFYSYGVVTTAAPGWALGTYLGVVMGNVLPPNIVSALGVGLYGMFLAIIIPPARKDKVVRGAVLVSMAASGVAAYFGLSKILSEGTVVILLTVVISAVFALLFPLKEGKTDEK